MIGVVDGVAFGVLVVVDGVVVGVVNGVAVDWWSCW